MLDPVQALEYENGLFAPLVLKWVLFTRVVFSCYHLPPASFILKRKTLQGLKI